jgi:hypothetical protein
MESFIRFDLLLFRYIANLVASNSSAEGFCAILNLRNFPPILLEVPPTVPDFVQASYRACTCGWSPGTWARTIIAY